MTTPKTEPRRRVKPQPLTERDIDILEELRGQLGGSCPRAWARPMDLGGRDWSHHTITLRKLVGRGLVDTKQRGSLKHPEGATGPGAWEDTMARNGWRGSRVYRINAAGKRYLRERKP